MNILESIRHAGNGAAVRQLGSQMGLDDAQTASALSALVPALSAGLRQNLQTPDGLSGLAAALSAGNHQRYVENPAVLHDLKSVRLADGSLQCAAVPHHVFGQRFRPRRDRQSRAVHREPGRGGTAL